MPLDVQISDDDLKGFSPQARENLKEAITDYATELIEEANRLEADRNATSGTPEVTRGMVTDANVSLRRGLGTPKKSWGLRVLRVVAAVLSLSVGFMYDQSKLQQSGGYLLLFILAVAAAILTVTITTLKE
jgi:hypothetical protein